MQMMKSFIYTLSLTIFVALIGCNGGHKEQRVDTSLNKKNSYQIEEAYGKQFEIGNSVYSVNQTSQLLESQDTVDVVLLANIESVCKMKGCWMNLVDTKSPNADHAFFVKFVDYGFFMPLDSEDYTVLVKGKAYKEITSVEELRHYAEDEGKSSEEIANITVPAEELKILSSGVYKIKG